MRMKSLFRKIAGSVLAVLMISGVVVFASGTAEAQRRVHRRPIIVYRSYRPFRPWWYGDPFWYGGYSNRYSHYVFSSTAKADAQGYKDGEKTGRDDGKKNKSFDPERSHYFQEAGFGNFAEVYRDAFNRGYSDGYRNGNRG